MKYIFISFLMLYCSITHVAFPKDLRELSKQERDEYLTSIAIKVAQTFGPDWYNQGKTTAVIQDSVFIFTDSNKSSRQKIKDNLGRKYYEVTLFYDKDTRKRTKYTFAAIVDIWADNGEPLEVIFGNNIGRNFIFLSYDEWLKMGVRKEDYTKYEEIRPNRVY